MPTYTGIWFHRTPGTPDNMNACSMQYGTEANRPAFPAITSFPYNFPITFVLEQDGVFYYATDTHKLFRARTAGWDEIMETDPAAATPGFRTLGSGAQQAAAGNHTH